MRPSNLFFSGVAALFLISCSGADIAPVSLTCEDIVNPSTVDRTAPRLSWINSPGKGVQEASQSAYRIIVSSSESLLSKEEGDLWDSGKVTSSESHLVPYGGSPLKSGQDCWWKVMVWDGKDTPSSWSEPSYWGMGLLDPSDWKATWIGAPWRGEEPYKEASRSNLTPSVDIDMGRLMELLPLMRSEDPADRQKFITGIMEMGIDPVELQERMRNPFAPQKVDQSPAPLLRKGFTVKGNVASAKAYVVGLGYYEFFVNGQKLGNEVLMPNQTNYGERPVVGQYGPTTDYLFRDYRVLYKAYDIKPLLEKGENVAGAILGEGFYNPTGYFQIPYGSSRLLAQIEITYEDGTKDIICSDPSWKAKESAIHVNGVFDGEVYDARCETPGWATTLVDDSSWENAVVRKAPTGKLAAHTSPGDVVYRTYKPKSVTLLEDGSYDVDFGTEITGWIRFRDFQGAEGDTLTVTYANDQQTVLNKYVFNGQKVKEYAPRFTWYTFSKANVKGLPGLESSMMSAEMICTNLPETSSFTSSNPMLEDINRIWKQSQLDNSHGGIASDCPQRERSGYTGDGQLSSAAVMMNFDAAPFYRKWIRDIADAQNTRTGHVPNIAPTNDGAGGIGWGAAIDIMPWEFYLQYGDKDMLKENYFAMTEYVRFMHELSDENEYLDAESDPDIVQNGGGQFGSLGDWLPPYGLPEKRLVHQFYYWMCTDICARAAKALGLDEDATLYAARAQKIKETFHKVFYDPVNRTYGDYGSNVFALKMGVPDEVKADVVETFGKEIVEKYNCHLNTGICGTRYLFEVLSENGMHDVAYKVMTQKDFPSFGWWLEQGATVTWENWNGESSRNHPMFGGCLTWLYNYLGGIRYDENEPGFRHVFIEPYLIDGLSVKCDKKTPYGVLSTSIEGDVLKVTVPVGVRASVKFGGNSVEVGQGTHTFTK